MKKAKQARRESTGAAVNKQRHKQRQNHPESEAPGPALEEFNAFCELETQLYSVTALVGLMADEIFVRLGCVETKESERLSSGIENLTGSQLAALGKAFDEVAEHRRLHGKRKGGVR